jgi:hypothetical protein
LFKEFYLKEIKKCLPKILESQDDKGSFHIPFQKSQTKIPNARWQEAVLTLAWAHERLRNDFLEQIERGISYWCSIQSNDGSFPELNKRSFPGTAFSSLAIAETLNLLGEKLDSNCFERATNALEKSAGYLIKNDVKVRTNQEAAALLALKKISKFTDIDDSCLNKKLKIIIKNKTSAGFFLEDGGVDGGYASLTCELLSMFGRQDLCHDFINSLRYLIFPDGTLACNFSRTKGWVILDALELLAREIPVSKNIAEIHIAAHERGLCDATHLPDLRHVMTDSYRLCWAYDNCKKVKVNAPLPFENKKWDKQFPEGILIVRRPAYMGVYYLGNRLTQSIWFNRGIITNLSSNTKGNTIVTDKFTHVLEDPKDLSYAFDGEKLILNVVCNKVFFKNKNGTKLGSGKVKKINPEIRGIFRKLFGIFSKDVIVNKTFKFKDEKIAIEVKAPSGIEQVPVLGEVKLTPEFIREKGEILGSSIFHNRDDFFILRKKFEKQLVYEIFGAIQ